MSSVVTLVFGSNTLYWGDDPGGYALSANIIRRHLNKGQQAMIIVKAQDDTFVSLRELGRNGPSRETSVELTSLRHKQDMQDTSNQDAE